MSMRKSSKFISLVIAVVFLLAAVTPAAFAAGHADDQADAGARLKALGIIEGYPDGTLRPENNITRAEMTVILSEMAGMSNASQVLAGIPSGFSDVVSNAWYTGYINLASQQGWVAGYPDGTFKPNAQVTFAEAVTMMLNVLGYEGSRLPGTWPSNYLVKAANLGITDGMSFSRTEAATRGDVFIMASRALDEYPVTWNADTGRYDEDEMPLLDRLGFEVLEDARIIDAYFLLGSSDAEKEDREVVVMADDEDEIYYIAEGVSVEALIGVEADFYVDDDVIVSVKSSEAVLSGEIDDLRVDGGNDQVKFKGNSTWYTVVDEAVIVNNRVLGDYGDIPDSGFISYTRSGRDITSVSIVNYDEMRLDGNFNVVKEVEVDDNFIDVKAYRGTEANLDTDDDTIYLIGVSSVDDIEEWDVIYWNNVDDDYVIYVVSDKATGSLTRYRDGDYARIAGTDYDVADLGYWTSSDMGDSWVADGSFEDFSGESVIAILDGYGDIVAVVADIDSAAVNVALTTTEVERLAGFGGTFSYRVRLLTAAGTQARYTLEDGDVEITVGGATETVADWFAANAGWQTDNKSSGLVNQVVEFSLNSDGELDELVVLAFVDDMLELIESDLNANRIRVGGLSYWATGDSVFYEVTYDGADFDEAKIISWDAVRDLEGEFAARLYADSDRDIIAVVFDEPAVSEDTDYAVVTDWWKQGEDEYVEIVTAEGVREYLLSSDSPIAFSVFSDGNYIVLYNLSSGEEVELELVTDVVYGEAPSSPYDSSRQTIKIGSNTYDMDIDAFVVNGTSVVSPSTVRRGDFLLAGLDDDGLVVVLIILDDIDDVPALYLP